MYIYKDIYIVVSFFVLFGFESACHRMKNLYMLTLSKNISRGARRRAKRLASSHFLGLYFQSVCLSDFSFVIQTFMILDFEKKID